MRSSFSSIEEKLSPLGGLSIAAQLERIGLDHNHE
jgi:hypothetical protein